MTSYDFENLELKYWDYIRFINEKGEGLMGNFEDEYENSKGTFKFSNHSSGRSEVIHLSNIQQWLEPEIKL